MAGDQHRFQVAMTHADRFSQEEKWADAMKAYRFALAEFPNSEAAIIGFGKAGLASGQIDLARKAFEEVLRIDPTNLEALGYMADIQERTGQLDAAAETYLRVGNVYTARGDLDTAIDSWTRATKLASGQVNAHLRIADALAQQGKIRPAAREYLTLAAIYQRRNDSERALEHVRAAQELLPNDPGVLAAREALHEGMPIQPGKISDTPPEPEFEEELSPDFEEDFSDDWLEDDLFDVPEIEERDTSKGGLIKVAQQKALEELANLIFEESDHPGTMVIMQALDLQSREEMDEAIGSFRQAIKAGANQPALYFNLGLLYQQQGSTNEAIEMLRKSAESQKYGLSSEFALGLTYNSRDDSKSTVNHFIKALKILDLQTVSGEMSYELAQTYENLAQHYATQVDADQMKKFISAVQNFFAKSDWEQQVYEARQRMNKVAEDGDTMSLAEFLETPETEVVVTTLAVTGELMKSNMLMSASEECLRAIQKAPSFLPLHSRLADILLKQDQTDQAITKYLFIADVYQMRNQPDQAVNVYHKILKLAPMDVTVRSKLIDLYTSQQDIDQALEQYLELADSYYQLAQVDRALEKYNEALRLAADAHQANRWKAEALTRMADIYNQRFDWASATSAYEKLIKLNPADEKILRQLIDLYFKQNRTNEAATTLDKLLSIYQRQNPLQAVELLKDLSGYYPENMSLRQRLAVAYAQNNMNREAIAEYDKLGEMQLENGLRDQAIHTIQAIINLGPDDVQGYRRLLEQIHGGMI